MTRDLPGSRDELRELRGTARDFFERHSDEAAVRSAMETAEGFDRNLWQLMAEQLGLQSLLIPEEFGGAEFAFTHLQIVLEEMGRALVCSPFLSSAVLAVQALLASHDRDRCAELLPRIADGSLIAALAFADRLGHWDPADDSVRATRAAGRWTLTGSRRFVLDAAAAEVILVAATSEDGPALYVVNQADTSCCVTPLETLDMTRRQADVTLDDAEATLIGDAGAADAYLRQAFDAGLAALSAEQVGGARRVLEMSVEYAKIREQFGRPIGSFQAIKHKCADMLLEVESATSAAQAACTAIAESSTEASLLASVAKSYCSEVYTRAAAENIQVHGGIGFTWEHAAHLYFRRAKSSEMLLGTPTYHRERILRELDL
jgi:alkylation response protein AidB-like acyl-CoA dehydrogenase